MEVQELRDFLEHQVYNTPIWIEMNGEGRLATAVTHEEVGIVIHTGGAPFYTDFIEAGPQP